MFAECMRPDGIVITTVPHLKGIWGKLGEKLNKEIVDGHVRMDLGDLVEVHRMAGLEVVYATYFKWLDVSVLNYEKLPLVVKKAIFGAYLGMDMVMNMLVRIYKGKLRPEALYSDMLVVAKK